MYVLSHLGTVYTKRNWEARDPFFMSSNQIRVTLSERGLSDTEKLQIIGFARQTSLQSIQFHSMQN